MPFEARFARFSVRHPRWVLAVVLLFVLGATGVIFRWAAFDSDVLNLLPQRFSSVRALKVYDREFTQARDVTFALWDESKTADLDAFTEFFGDALRKESWVVRVLDRSPMDLPDGAREVQRLAVPLLLDQPAAAFAATLRGLEPAALERRFALKRTELEAGSPKAELELRLDPLGVVAPALAPFSASFSTENTRPLAAADGTLRVVAVTTTQGDLSEKTCRELMAKVDDFKARVLRQWADEMGALAPAPEILATGRTAYVAELASGMWEDVAATLIGSVLLVSGVFFVGFWRLRPLGAILLVLFLCCLGTVAAGSLIFGKLNVVTMGLCSILIGLGVDFGMLLYGAYQAARAGGLDHPGAAHSAARQVGRSILCGAATIAAAFLSLLLSESLGFAQLGVLIGVGILGAAGLMLCVFFVFVGAAWKPAKIDPLRWLTEGYLRHLLRRPLPVLCLTLTALLALSAFALSPFGRVKIAVNPQSLEPPGSRAGFALRTIKEKLIGNRAEPVLAIVEGRDAEDFHRQWQAAQAHWQAAKEQGEIAGFSTPAALAFSPKLEAANLAALRGFDVAASRAALSQTLETHGFDAESLAGAFDLLAALETLQTGDRAPLEWRKALPESSSWRFVIDRFLSANPTIGAAYVTPNATIANAREQAALRAALTTPGLTNVAYTGWSYVMADLVPWSASKLALLCVVMVAFNLLLLTLIYRAPSPVAILMLSLALSIGTLVAVLKWTGLPLNLFNVLAFPLVLGMGIDYGIYALLAVRQKERSAAAMAAIIKPVLLSGLTTIAGFGSLVLANHPALSSLGAVCALGVACCLFSTLFVVLPAALWWRGRAAKPDVANGETETQNQAGNANAAAVF